MNGFLSTMSQKSWDIWWIGTNTSSLCHNVLEAPKEAKLKQNGKIKFGGTLSSVQVMTEHSLFLQAISEMTILTMANHHYSCMMQQAHWCQHPPCDNLLLNEVGPQCGGSELT